MNTLILMVGLPRSGKSTEAMALGYPVVSPDAIRLALHGQRFLPSAEPMVWAIARYMVNALFIAGHTQVVLDATNVTLARRAEWHSSKWDTKLFWVDTPAHICKARALATDQPDVVGAIDRMVAEFERPFTWWMKKEYVA